MDYPKLRPLEALPVEHNGQTKVGLRDPLGLVEGILVLPPEVLPIVALMDGRHSIVDIQSEYMRRHGELLFSDTVRHLIAQLDEHYLLDSERFRQYYDVTVARFRSAPVRQAAHAGLAYPAEASALAAQLESLLAAEESGLPAAPTDDTLAAVLAPHIDLRRGGVGFGRAYAEVARHCQADLFVILGTVHAPTSQRFALTAKDFQTPLGLAETDKAFVQTVVRHAGQQLFDDEFAHRAEHSIEFQVLFLQFLFGNRRPFRIVPILVGSFQDFVTSGQVPIEDPAVRGLIEAVGEAAAGLRRPPCYVAGADLAHVGLRFGDARRLTAADLARVRREDHELLDRAAAADARGFFEAIVRQQDRNRICGFPPTYMMLELLRRAGRPRIAGRLLCYDQAVEPDHSNCVSFAGMAFYREGAG